MHEMPRMNMTTRPTRMTQGGDIPTGRCKVVRARHPEYRLQIDRGEYWAHAATENHIHDMVIPYFVV